MPASVVLSPLFKANFSESINYSFRLLLRARLLRASLMMARHGHTRHQAGIR